MMNNAVESFVFSNTSVKGEIKNSCLWIMSVSM